MNFFKHTSIAIKATVIVLLALVPMAYLLYELVEEKNIAITFSANELGGNRLVSLAHEVSIATAQARGNALNGKVDGRDILASFETFKKEAVRSDYVVPQTLQNTELAITAAIHGSDHAKALSQLHALIGEISDRSNLTLDPDVDTYYVMELVTMKAPGLIKVLSDIHATAFNALGAGSLSHDTRIALFVLKGGLENILDGIRLGRDKSFAGNEDGLLKPAVESEYKDAIEATSAFFSAIETTILADEYRVLSKDDLNRKYTEALSASAELWSAAEGELGRMITKRIDAHKKAQTISIAATVAMIIITLAMLIVITHSITRPISELIAAMKRLTNQETDISIPGQDRKDEVGNMARATEALRKVAGAFKLAMSRIESSVTVGVTEVAGSSKQIQASAHGLNRIADETKRLSTAVAAASTQAAQTSSHVAASAEELTASISEISSKVQQSSHVAMAAAGKGEAINQAMLSLAEKSARVSEVIGVIRKIAEQINLLALNATIEAARAGEAGRGFAVVASEVKALSNQTAKAAGEITQQIAEMQGATKLAVDSVDEIMGIIDEISTNITAVAAAVEEQSAATNEIARNIAQTATGTQEISQNIVTVERGAEETGSTSKEMLDAISGLNNQTVQLKDKVEQFLKEMRAA